jgi:hypothetical protein
VKVDHPFRTVLQTTVRVEKVKDVLPNFTTKLLQALSFIREHVDETAAYVPKRTELTDDHIVDKTSFPTVVYTLNQRYFQVESRTAFTSALKTPSGRTIHLSLVMGSSIKITPQLLEEFRHDVGVFGVTFWYKPYQEVDTSSQIAHQKLSHSR